MPVAAIAVHNGSISASSAAKKRLTIYEQAVINVAYASGHRKNMDEWVLRYVG